MAISFTLQPNSLLLIIECHQPFNNFGIINTIICPRFTISSLLTLDRCSFGDKNNKLLFRMRINIGPIYLHASVLLIY